MFYTKMQRLKTARLIFCIAALMLVAKPFIGFSLVRHIKSPVATNIIAKTFNKRKSEDALRASAAIQHMLLNPAENVALLFVFLLSLLFPLAFLAFNGSNNRFLSRLQLSLQPQPLTVANSQFRI